MTETATVTDPRPRFSAEMWAAYWAAPDIGAGTGVLADDIVGYWPGASSPVHGLTAYLDKIAALLTAYPDLRLELVDSATVPGGADEELIFLHYVGTATGPQGRVWIRGLDRVRTRDGVVVENVIRYDPSVLAPPVDGASPVTPR
jgi:hypothetical protein